MKMQPTNGGKEWGYCRKVCLGRLVSAMIPPLMWNARCSSLSGTGWGHTFSGETYALLLRQVRGGWITLPTSADSQLASAQNNLCAEVAFLGVSHILIPFRPWRGPSFPTHGGNKSLGYC